MKKEKTKEIRYCKKKGCNCELASENKTGYCEKHNRKIINGLKAAGSAVVSLVGVILVLPRFLGKK